jgi:hypothetical protein
VPTLAALDALAEARVVVTTKAYARRPNFYTSKVSAGRKLVVLDEDPVGLLRPAVDQTRSDLEAYVRACGQMESYFLARQEQAWAQAGLLGVSRSRRVAEWCLAQMKRQQPDGQREAVPVPDDLPRGEKAGRKVVAGRLRRMMPRDPEGMVRNVHGDLDYLLGHAAARAACVRHDSLLFHLRLDVPRSREVLILDATANPALLRPIFGRRRVEVLADERVRPAGRVIQFPDGNYPHSHLAKVPPPGKVLRVIDAIGDRHPAGQGNLVLISFLGGGKEKGGGVVERLRQASRHKDRLLTAHFGAVRGRNDLMSTAERPVAAYIVAGSPKTTEEDRRRLALAVYGKDLLPFADLADVRRVVTYPVPRELADGDEEADGEIRLSKASPRTPPLHPGSLPRMARPRPRGPAPAGH